MTVITIRRSPWEVKTYTDVTSIVYNGHTVAIYQNSAAEPTITLSASAYIVRIMSNAATED